jgi:hypothetical protein
VPRRSKRDPAITRLHWVIGTPYAVQGSTNLVEVPILYFIKFVLGMGDAGGQLFDALRNGGWFVKPLWGYVSDRVPLFGYRRKSWFVLMALLAVVFWGLNAALVAAGVRVPFLFLFTFNLAFATYAFVDVVCDAIMVTRGRELRQVGAFVIFQWTVLAIANAGAVFVGAWLQQRVEAGEIPLALIFLLTAVPPLLTAVVGFRNIDEKKGERAPKGGETRHTLRYRLGRTWATLKENRTIFILTVFLFFWKFSPSVGYIERSYLIDERGFEPASFGTILAAGSVTFLLSMLSYRLIVRHVTWIRWHHYLYAMVAVGLLSFPLSFYLYLDAQHPWWAALSALLPKSWQLPEGWNRYEGFRLLTEIILGFATTPALIIPLTIAAETVKVERAGVSYAFLMAFANITNMFEGMVGAGLYKVLSHARLDPLIAAFGDSVLNVAGSTDERTLILQIFVYVSLVFTLLTLPFLHLLRGELERQKIEIDLVGGPAAG